MSRPKVDLSAFDHAGKHVLDTSVEEAVSQWFLEYSYSVIYSRALPDARDGLKPVHRRILYGMSQMGLRPDRGYVKSGRVVGEVMGKFHPHGDSAIYEALVRMAQPWSLNTPLVDGHGNFGSLDDGPAASRYTEARPAPAALLMTGELSEDTVEYHPNYSGDTDEPVVLPAAFPNLLVNGAAGIAVGMSTNMIPHNLGEVVTAARWLLTHPNASLDKLMEFVPGPDLPSGGLLLGMDKVREAYETGRGVVRMRARASIGPLEGSRGRQAITVTELPYGVGPEKVIDAIKKGLAAKKIVGVAEVKDLTDLNTDGTRLVVECRVGVNPDMLLASLYKHTPMEASFGINNLALVDGEPRTLGLKDLLQVFLDHRAEVVTRRTQHRRTKRADRLHIVEGLSKALINIDKVIKVVRGADDQSAARDGLMRGFNLSEVQANYILDTPLRRLTKYDRLELDHEAETLKTEIAELDRILDDEAALRQLIGDELTQVAKQFAIDRRTTLVDGDLAEVLEDTTPVGPLEVADDPCRVFLSATGLIARTAAESEAAPEMRRQGGRVKHDTVRSTARTTARGEILLITNHGRAHRVPVLPIPALPDRPGIVSLRSGVPADALAALQAGEAVVAVAPAAANGIGLALGTRDGVVKVASPDWPVRSDVFEVISLKAGDEVVGAGWVSEKEDTLVFVTSAGSLLRYDAALVRPQGAKGGGVAGISLPDGAEVVAFNAIPLAGDADPCVVTCTGVSAKATTLSVFPSKGRGTGGVRAHRFLKGEARLVAAWVGRNQCGSGTDGSPVELPDVDSRRDGSGQAGDCPALLGGLVERG